MKRINLLLLFFLAFGTLMAQSHAERSYNANNNSLEGAIAIDCYDFDDLTVGDYVAGQLGGMWTTWAGTPGGADDAFVSDDQSNSPDNSFVVNDAAVDLVFKLAEEPIETGAWLYSHYIYIPTGTTGYFNVQSSPIPGEDWVIELFFDDDGTGYFEGGSSDTYEYDPDTWIFIEINFDLDTDLAQVFFDGVMMTEFANEFTIGGIDYYGDDGNGPPGAYYDDVCFGDGTPISNADCYDFDDLDPGEFLALQLGGMWTTWSGIPGGSGGDGFVSNDQSHSPNNSFVIWENINDVVFKLDEEPIETGAWLYSHYIYVPTGHTGYFNVQSSPIPGEEWVIELYFNGDGTGYFEGGSSGTYEFSNDTWIFVEINFDLDTDLARVFFDGVMIAEFANEFTIGGINYYGADTNGDPEAYYDDVCFGEGTPIYVGIEEVSADENIIIYPNPAQNVVHINTSVDVEQIQLINNSGQLVLSSYSTGKQMDLDISELEPGIYFVKIFSSKNIVFKKLIVN